MSVSINGDNGLTFNDGSSQATAATGFGFKNRIINGAMVIDQRNVGASVTVNTATGSSFYAVDRFFGQGQAADGVFTMQRSTTAPTGFTNSLLVTVTTADTSLGASQAYQIVQPIEGFNVADLAWGSASAATVTVSFWVRSSVTGTFGGSVFNASANRSYPFTYSISSANTFEQKSVTIPGDTTGTWGTGNGVGIYLIFGLGVGSTLSGTANTWAASQYNSATGATNLMATLNATWYITGVQLEKGSTATSFDYRPYGTELMLCQRYYFKIGPAAAGYRVGVGYAASTTLSDALFVFPVIMRTAPTALEQTGTAGDYGVQQAAGGTACSAVPTFQTATNQTATTRQTVASGLTTGQGNFARLQTTSGYFAWSAEL